VQLLFEKTCVSCNGNTRVLSFSRIRVFSASFLRVFSASSCSVLSFLMGLHTHAQLASVWAENHACLDFVHARSAWDVSLCAAGWKINYAQCGAALLWKDFFQIWFGASTICCSALPVQLAWVFLVNSVLLVLERSLGLLCYGKSRAALFSKEDSSFHIFAARPGEQLVNHSHARSGRSAELPISILESRFLLWKQKCRNKILLAALHGNHVSSVLQFS
jgi:hypothetical protein